MFLELFDIDGFQSTVVQCAELIMVVDVKSL